MNTTLDYLFRVESPWIYVGVGETERMKVVSSYFYSRADVDVCVRRLRGKKMRTVPALMDEFGASLQFFEGFGENWYALQECLEYLDEWLPAAAYILVVENAEELLLDEQPDQMAALLKTLQHTGEWWSTPITDNDRFDRDMLPFHVLLHVSENDSAAIERIVRIAADANVPVRR